MRRTVENTGTMRCAIYTRKSTEDGLEQEYNSLDAQREACEAYIASQRHEGWVCMPDMYDDGGFSGGTLERPGLQRLLEDIRNKKVDLILVYKVDRLSRSLLDFAKLVELFEDNNVSFVSITQSFCTNTAMGKLTLNMLLSFAEFERAIISERVRDKIAGARILASGSSDYNIKLWDVTSGHEIRTLSEHRGSVLSVSFSPDGKTLASGGGDRIIRLWDVSLGVVINMLDYHNNGIIYSLAFSPDGKTLASGSGDNAIRLWDISSGQVMKTLCSHTGSVLSIAFSPDGRYLVSGSSDKTIRFWDTSTWCEIKTFSSHTSDVRSVAFSHDGKILVSSSDDKTIKLWDIPNGCMIRTLTEDNGWVYSVALSPDGKTLASGSGDKMVRLWDISDVSRVDSISGTRKSSATTRTTHESMPISTESEISGKSSEIETKEPAKQTTPKKEIPTIEDKLKITVNDFLQKPDTRTVRPIVQPPTPARHLPIIKSIIVICIFLIVLGLIFYNAPGDTGAKGRNPDVSNPVITNAKSQKVKAISVVRPQPAKVDNKPQLGEIKINPRDGAEMVWIPSGKFLMGSNDGNDDGKPQNTVFLNGYWIYKYEVI